MKHRKTSPVKLSIEETTKLELKALPPHLIHVFLEKNYSLLVIIASYLKVGQVECLVVVLKRFKRAIGLTIADIIGIRPGLYSQKIKLMPDHKTSIEHQRRLNPPMQEVLKK